MNLVGQGLPLAIVAALLATLAVTGARRAAWIALAALVLVAGVLEFPDDGHYPAGLLLRLAALWGATLIVLPTGLFDFAALRRDLSPRVIAETLSEHPVVAASALAGLLLGAVPLALPIETSVAPVALRMSSESPVWSPWPWVRSTCVQPSEACCQVDVAAGFPVKNGSTRMTDVPVSMRKAEWPW